MRKISPKRHAALVFFGLLAACGIGLAIGLALRHSPEFSASTTRCPETVGAVQSRWCLNGETNGLPWSMTIWTRAPFIVTKGPIVVTGDDGPHEIARGCGGSITGSIIVPVYYSIDQGINPGPTGGDTQVSLTWHTVGRFHVNNPDGQSQSATLFDESYGTRPFWRCSRLVTGVLWDKPSSTTTTAPLTRGSVPQPPPGQIYNNSVMKNEDYGNLLGYFVMTDWEGSPWKVFMASHSTLRFAINQSSSDASERITRFSGPDVTVEPKDARPREVIIRLLGGRLGKVIRISGVIPKPGSSAA